jgi:hypothetical protein
MLKQVQKSQAEIMKVRRNNWNHEIEIKFKRIKLIYKK